MVSFIYIINFCLVILKIGAQNITLNLILRLIYVKIKSTIDEVLVLDYFLCAENSQKDSKIYAFEPARLNAHFENHIRKNNFQIKFSVNY